MVHPIPILQPVSTPRIWIDRKKENKVLFPALLKLPDQPNDNGLLSLQDATELVHRAHSAGLTTYFSAGFKTNHIRVAVYSGVDGIGMA